MSLRPHQIIVVSVIVLSFALPLAACGKKGKLEPPPGSEPGKSDVQLPNYQ